jgi:hypothetical protein
MTTTQSTSENTHLTVRGAWEGNLDFLEVTPLGAGSEVGRSCILLKFRGKTILLDCGIHPAYTGLASLPFFDAIENANKIDLLLISQYVLFLNYQKASSNVKFIPLISLFLSVFILIMRQHYLTFWRKYIHRHFNPIEILSNN